VIAALDGIMRRATAVLALLGSVGIFAMLIHVCAYVVGRHLAASPIPATVEIVSNYYMILIAFLPLAWAERRGDMISIEIFAQMLGGPLKRINALLVSVITAGAYAILTATTWLVAMREFATSSFVISLSVHIPIWPSYFVLPISFGLATIVCLLKVVLLAAGNRIDGAPGHAAEEEFRQ
jgi:TRAP-type C4-dicarboxylate transport system permease small subunit